MLIGERMWYLHLCNITLKLIFARRDTACHFRTAETKRLSHAALEAHHFFYLFIIIFLKHTAVPLCL